MTTNTEWLYIVTDSNKAPNGFFIPPEMLGMEDGRNIAVLYNNSHYDQSHCQVSIVYYPYYYSAVPPIAARCLFVLKFLRPKEMIFSIYLLE